MEPTIEDAISYMNNVKEAFHYEPEKYDEFSKILFDVTSNRMDEESGIARMRDLIKEHPMLLIRLRFFCPASNADEITILPEAKITIPLKAKITNLPKANLTNPLKIKITIPRKASRTIPPKAEQPTDSDELKFMNMLKTRFRKLDTHVVGSFREIMEMYNKGKKSVKEVQEEVVDLLYYHEDLIDDFSKIFPRLGSFSSIV